MKIIVVNAGDHFVVAGFPLPSMAPQWGGFPESRDNSGVNKHAFTFNTQQEVDAFMSGFNCAKHVINSLVQSLPMTYEVKA